MVSNRSAPRGPVIPVLVYANVGLAIDWLCEVFGFTEVFRYGEPGNPAGAQLAVGEGSVFLKSLRDGPSSEPDDHTKLVAPRPNEITHSVMVSVDDIDVHHERVARHGAKILGPPQTYPFGERQYTVEDPERHRWSFTQSVADAAPEDWGGQAP